jgi:hypothetical protein
MLNPVKAALEEWTSCTTTLGYVPTLSGERYYLKVEFKRQIFMRN